MFSFNDNEEIGDCALTITTCITFIFLLNLADIGLANHKWTSRLHAVFPIMFMNNPC